MYIIQIQADENGARPPLLTWNKATPPHGYASCPNEFYEIFYSTEVACGFVNIIIEDGIVTSMEVNQEAYDAYVASLPEPEVIDETDSLEAQMNALLGEDF